MYRPRHIAEYAALKFVSKLVNVLPQSAALGLGSAVAPVGFRFNLERRSRAVERIGQVFGDLSEADVTRIAQASFRDLIWHAIEILRTPKVTIQWTEENTVMEQGDRDRLDAAVAREKGVILAVPHLANWDLAGIALQQLGYPMTFIYRNQKNPLFNRHLSEMRKHLGSELIERDDPMLLRKTLRSLRKGNIVAILVDLRARQNDLQVPFLGHTAELARGLGLMSHMSGCPVVPAYATRPQCGRLRWHFKEAILPDPSLNRNDDAERILRQTLPPLEAAIRAHPEQYFWFNKRWVLEPTVRTIGPEEASSYIKTRPQWSIADDSRSISRKVNCKSFVQAMRLLNKIADLADSQKHHPDLHLTGYRNVRIELMTHAIGGLSEKDFMVAAKIDEILG